jgi:hypothetical protein
MVDFSDLVLGPCMDAFAGPTDRNQPITWFPIVSIPDSGPMPGMRGIWRYVDREVALDDGSILTTTEITLGIRLADWPVIPSVGDGLTAPLGTYLIDKIKPDSQGGASLVLKAGQPVPATG